MIAPAPMDGADDPLVGRSELAPQSNAKPKE